jgi:hypothetical protein
MEKDYQLRQHAEEQLKSIISNVLWDSRADGESLMEFLEKHETDGQPLTDMQLHKFAAHWVYRLALCNNLTAKEEPEKFFIENIVQAIIFFTPQAKERLEWLCMKEGKEKGMRSFLKEVKEYTETELMKDYVDHRINKSLSNDQIIFIKELYKKYEPEILDRKAHPMEEGQRNSHPDKRFYATLYSYILGNEPYYMRKVVFCEQLSLNFRTLDNLPYYDFLVEKLKEDIKKSRLF